MTRNQIEYQKHLEQQRSNRAQEALTGRSIDEQVRSNQARESENYRSNLARETENTRSNQARERETFRHDVNTEILTAGLNAETARSNLARELENARANQAREELTALGYEVNRGIENARLLSAAAIANADREGRLNVAQAQNASREKIASQNNLTSASISSAQTASRERIAEADRTAQTQRARESNLSGLAQTLVKGALDIVKPNTSGLSGIGRGR